MYPKLRYQRFVQNSLPISVESLFTLIFVDDLINSGYIQLFITLLTEERTELHEHILSALLAIIKNNENAISECRKEKYGLQSIISNHLQQIEKIDEAMVRFLF